VPPRGVVAGPATPMGPPRGEGYSIPELGRLHYGRGSWPRPPSYAALAAGGMGYHEAGSPGVSAGLDEWADLRRAVSSVAYVSPCSSDGAAAGQRVPLCQRMRAALKLLFGPVKTAGG